MRTDWRQQLPMLDIMRCEDATWGHIGGPVKVAEFAICMRRLNTLGGTNKNILFAINILLTESENGFPQDAMSSTLDNCLQMMEQAFCLVRI